jgi:hypothetical protein
MNQNIIVSKEILRDTLKRHKDFLGKFSQRSFLNHTKIYAPSVGIHLKQNDDKFLDSCEHLETNYINPDILIKEIENYNLDQLNDFLAFKGQYLVSVGQGDFIPLASPLQKIPWLEAMIGCPLKMTEGQIWPETYPHDLEDLLLNGIHFESNPWFQLYLDFIKKLQNRIKNRFFISSASLIRGPSDLVANIMGVEEACIGWLENPSLMARLMRFCTDAILTVVEAGKKVLKKSYNGYPSKWGIWSPNYIIDTQSDHSVLVSPEIYKQQILPYDSEVIRSCPVSIFHIHNNGLHIVPALIAIPELDIIEVMIDPYPIEESRKFYELEILKEILKYKSLMIDVYLPNLEEYRWLLDNLPKKGLFFRAMFDYDIYTTLPEDFPGKQIWIPE